MVEYKFNEPYYNLHFSELDENAAQVLSFEGEEKISHLFKYKISLISEDEELDAQSILNNKATFILNRGDEDPVKLYGIISHFEQRGRTPDYVLYYAELVPKMWRLGLTYQSEIYQNMDIEQLITKVLEDSDYTGQDYKFDLGESYPQREYIVQYRESNLNFINRRLEHFGIFYYFDHSSDNDVIVFTDNNDDLPEIDQEEDIYYNPNRDRLSEKETIADITMREKIVTGLVRLKDYNYLFPEKQMTVESQIESDHPGIYYEYGDYFEDENEGELLARIRNEEILSESKIFHGSSDCRLFHAGHKFMMGKHYREDLNATYLLTSIKYRGTQRNLFGTLPDTSMVMPTYENQFEAIPEDVPYRPKRRTPVPKISSIMSAKVESATNDEYAYIDDHGRYKLKMLFDLTDRSDGEASLPVRLSQPYAGTGYGIHFPNHADNEMIWACVDGNVDRPIGLGTIPNPAKSSPVKAENKMQNVIRTASGNEMIMHDKIEETNISLTTADAHNILLDDKEDKIQIQTTEKHQVTMDDKNQNITVQSKDGHFILMDDKNTKITVQSKNGHRISINDTDGSENITMVDSDGANTFVIDISNKKLVILTKEGDIDMHAPEGMIDIKAKNFNLETTEDTTMKADANISAESGGDCDITVGGNMTEEVTGDLSQKGNNVTTEAAMDYTNKGMNVTSEASMEYKLKGMNVTSEAGVNQQVKGSMITVQSSGPNTIKGMPVMIN